MSLMSLNISYEFEFQEIQQRDVIGLLDCNLAALYLCKQRLENSRKI